MRLLYLVVAETTNQEQLDVIKCFSRKNIDGWGCCWNTGVLDVSWTFVSKFAASRLVGKLKRFKKIKVEQYKTWEGMK